MDKRGVVAISTFSFIVFILISLFALNYYFYESFKENLEILNKETALTNSINSFKAEILDLVLENSSYLDYDNSLDSEEFIFYVEDSSIYSSTIFKENLIEESSSLYGVKFCSNYSFAPATLTKFYFDGICISKIS